VPARRLADRREDPVGREVEPHRHADRELCYALEDSGAKVLFTARDIGALPACVEHVVDAADGHEDLVAGAEPADFPDDVSEDDLAGLFYTGGTTGASKGVMLCHRSLVSQALHLQAVLPFEPDTCFLVVAPMFHLAGTLAVLATVWHGGRQIVMRAFEVDGSSVTSRSGLPALVTTSNGATIRLAMLVGPGGGISCFGWLLSVGAGISERLDSRLPTRPMSAMTSPMMALMRAACSTLVALSAATCCCSDFTCCSRAVRRW